MWSRLRHVLCFSTIDGKTCGQSLDRHPFHSFLFCKYGEGETTQIGHETLHRLITQAVGFVDIERYVPVLDTKVRATMNAELLERCALLDVVSWFP